MDENSIDSLFRMLRQIDKRERAAKKRQHNTRTNQVLFRLYLALFVLPFFLALSAAFARNFLGIGDWGNNAALILLAVAYLGVILHLFLSILVSLKSYFNKAKSPLSPLLENAKVCANADVKLLHHLMAKPLAQLKFLLMQINAEKEAFQKRVALTVGAIEKVGLIPGFLAMAVTLSKLGEDQPEWLLVLAYAAPALHITGVALHYLSTNLEHMANLISHAIEVKEMTNASREAQ